jgi:hypothetical protein
MTRSDPLDPLEPIEGLTLPTYVAACRALVRMPASIARRPDALQAAIGLDPDVWARVRHGWSARIRLDPAVRAEFGRLYADPSTGSVDGRPTGDEAIR